MHARDLTIGRTFGLTFEHDEDFFIALTDFCNTHDVRQGCIPMFIAGFAEADIVRTYDKLENPAAPVWTKVHLTNVESLGCGTLPPDPETGIVQPHIHQRRPERALSHRPHNPPLRRPRPVPGRDAHR